VGPGGTDAVLQAGVDVGGLRPVWTSGRGPQAEGPYVVWKGGRGTHLQNRKWENNMARGDKPRLQSDCFLRGIYTVDREGKIYEIMQENAEECRNCKEIMRSFSKAKILGKFGTEKGKKY